MEPIISPWIFYGISTLSSIRCAFIGFGIVLIISAAIIYISHDDDSKNSSFNWSARKLGRSIEYLEDKFQDLVEMYEQSIKNKDRFETLLKDAEVIVKEHRELYNDMNRVTASLKNGKRNFLIGLILLNLAIFIPNSDTMYRMVVASYVTSDNIQTGVTITNDVIQQLIDKIIEAAKAVK